MAGPGPGRPSWLRFSGIGFEFAAAVGGFALLGYWLVDRNWDTWPWGMIIGVMLGLVGGGYNLIRESMGAFKKQEGEKPKPPARP